MHDNFVSSKVVSYLRQDVTINLNICNVNRHVCTMNTTNVSIYHTLSKTIYSIYATIKRCSSIGPDMAMAQMVSKRKGNGDYSIFNFEITLLESFIIVVLIIIVQISNTFQTLIQFVRKTVCCIKAIQDTGF